MTTWLALSVQARHVYASPALRVRARVQLEVHAAHSDTTVSVHGTIRDDLDVPLAQRELVLRVSGSADDATRRPPVSGSADDATRRPLARQLHSDASGRFAATFSVVPASYRVLVAFDGDAFYERAELALNLDAAHVPLELQFVRPDERQVNLDQASLSVVVHAHAPGGAEGLPIVLKDELARLVASGRTDQAGDFKVDVPTSRLGEPGMGEINAECAGDAARAAASTTKTILRTRATTTALEAHWDAAQRKLELVARLHSAAGPLANKALGVFITRAPEEHLITLTTNARGEARRSLELPAQLGPGTHHLRARYETDTVGLGASESLEASVTVAAPATLSGIWLIVPALASSAFALWSARRVRRAEVSDERVANGIPAVQLGAAVRGNIALFSVDGIVLDMERGTPIAATLTFVAGSGQGLELGAGQDGRFRSPALPADTYRVVALAPGYARAQFELRIPHAGTGTGVRLALRNLRSAALDAHAQVARRIFQSEARLQVATVRDAWNAARSGVVASASLGELTDLVESTAYARATPSGRDLERVEQVATEVLADLDRSAGKVGDPTLE